MAILYLDVSNLLGYLISAQLARPLSNLFTLKSGPRIPLYELTGDFSVFAWAIPVALVFSFLFMRIVKRKVKLQAFQAEQFLIICGLIGLLLIVIGFIQRGSVAERYTSTPGFLLLVVPASFMIGYIFNSNKFMHIVALAIIALVIFSGSTSLSWAPDLYPNEIFEYSGITEYTVASNLVHFIPNNSSLGAILSIGDPLTSNLDLAGKNFTLIGSFYNYVLDLRSVDVCTLSNFAVFGNSIFIISTNSLSNGCRDPYDVVSSSGGYSTIMIPRRWLH
jgi:hypothetical protein